MGNDYIPSFVKQLSSNCALPISAISSKTKVELSQIYICSQLSSLAIDAQQLYISQQQRNQEGYNPDINYLFTSMAKISSQLNVMAVILTGIGDDGVSGCQLLAENNVYCIAESAQTAIVDGMPMQARNQVKDIHVFTLDEIITKIQLFAN